MYVRRLALAMSWFAALVVAVLLILPLIGQTQESADQAADETEDSGPRRVAVTYVEAVPQRIEDIERTLATVEAKWSASIAAEVAATVETIAVDAGDRVERGMLLATLDSRDLEIEVARASANVRRLETTIASRERDVERQRQLAERGHVSESALEAVESELGALRQELEVAQSELQRAERNLERAQILAPHAGTVARRRVSEGDYVTAGTVILEIPRADRLQVRIPVPETVAERLEPAMPVRLSTVASHGNIAAEITQIEPQVSPTSRTVTVIAEIDNPGGWRPGNSVNAEIVLDTRSAIALPPRSVVRRPAGNVVFVVKEGEAHERVVSLGQRTREWIEIVDGIEPGDRVIVDGAGFMSDGAAVNARPHDAQPEAAGIAAREGSSS